MEDKEQKIKLTYETNADATGQKVDGLNKKLDTSAKETEKVSEAQKKAKKSTGDLSEGIEDLGGPIGGAISGFKAMIKQMWALVANPIGAVLAAIAAVLALVAKAFTNSFAGGEKLEQVMAGISATGQALLDNLDKIGRAIVKVFTFDFAGAKKEMQDVVNAAEGAYKKMSALKKESQQLERDQADNDLDAIKRQATLADLKDKLLDPSIGYKEKKKIQSELLKASEENAKSDIDLARKIATNKIAALTLEKDGAKKNYVEIQKIKAEQLRGEVDNSRELKQIRKAGATLDNEEKARLKEITAAKTAAYKERLSKQKEAQKLEDEEQKKQDDKIKALLKEKIDAENNLKKFNEDLSDKTEEQKLARQKERALTDIEILRQKGVDVEEITRLNAEKFNILENELATKRADEKKVIDDKIAADAIEAAQKQADQEIAIAKAKQAQEEAIQDAKLGLAQKGIALFGAIFDKSKKAQKAALIASNAVGLAEVAIDTVRAVSKDNAASPLTLGMPWSGIHIAQGAIGAGSIIASTAKGLKELGGGNAGSAPDIAGAAGGGAVSAAPQVNFQASSENQIGNTISNSNKDLPPIKAFVVGKDVTTQQSLDNNKINSNSI